jgi:hypothetical protein
MLVLKARWESTFLAQVRETVLRKREAAPSANSVSRFAAEGASAAK